MNEADDVLEGIAAAGRRRDADEDPRWEAFAAGDLSPEDEQALRALADSSPEHARAWEAFLPLDDAALARIADHVDRELDAGAPVAEPTAAAEAPRASSEVSRGSVVVPLRRRAPARSLAWAGAAVGVLAAAAALVLVLRAPAAPPLPGYSLEVLSSEGPLRSDGRTAESAATVRLRPDTRFQAVLRPATAVTGPVAVRVYERTKGGLRVVPAETEVADGGAVRLTGRAGDLFGAGGGEREILVVIGRPEAIPGPEALAEIVADRDDLLLDGNAGGGGTGDGGTGDGGPGGEAGWLLLRQRVLLETSP